MRLIRRRSGRPAVGKRLDWIKANLLAKYAKGSLPKATRWRMFLESSHRLLTGQAQPNIGVRRLEEQLRALPASRLDRNLPWLWKTLNVYWDDVGLPSVNPVVLGYEFAVRDWMLATNPTVARMTWVQAVEAAEAWHTELAESKRLSLAAEITGQILHRWPDGWTLQNLVTKQMMLDEGEIMGHCIGSAPHYWANTQAGKAAVWSLRDHRNVAHVTLYLFFESRRAAVSQVTTTHTLYEIQGTANTAPKSEYLMRLLSAPLLAKVHLGYGKLADLKTLQTSARQLQKSKTTWGATYYKGLEIKRKKDKLRVAMEMDYQERSVIYRLADFQYSYGPAHHVASLLEYLLGDQGWMWGELHWPEDSESYFGDNDLRDWDDDDDDDDEEDDDGKVGHVVQRAAQAALREFLLKPFGTLEFKFHSITFVRVFDVPNLSTEAEWMAQVESLRDLMWPDLLPRVNKLMRALVAWKPPTKKYRMLPTGEPHDKMLHPISRKLRARTRELLREVYAL
jgi:hypothetical protein